MHTELWFTSFQSPRSFSSISFKANYLPISGSDYHSGSANRCYRRNLSIHRSLPQSAAVFSTECRYNAIIVTYYCDTITYCYTCKYGFVKVGLPDCLTVLGIDRSHYALAICCEYALLSNSRLKNGKTIFRTFTHIRLPFYCEFFRSCISGYG